MKPHSTITWKYQNIVRFILYPGIDSVVEEVVFALPEVAAGIERGSAALDAGALVVELEDDSIDNLLSKF